MLKRASLVPSQLWALYLNHLMQVHQVYKVHQVRMARVMTHASHFFDHSNINPYSTAILSLKPLFIPHVTLVALPILYSLYPPPYLNHH